MARRFRSRRGGGSRQRTTWNNFGLDFALPATGVIGFFDITPVPLVASVEGANEHGTAVCQRLLMSFSLTQDNVVADVHQNMALGVYVTNQAAIDGFAFRPPLLSTEADWYYWTARSTFKDATEERSLLNWDVDIRTKRRLSHGQRLVVVAASDPLNSSAQNLTWGIRALWAISN